MSPTHRNIDDYVEQYKALPFEQLQIQFRRKLVLNQISRFAPRRLLEVGCGELPLFLDLPTDIDVTIVEPAAVFVENARTLASGMERINILQGYIETADLKDSQFDMIVLSCVLHEVPDPTAMLTAIARLCGPSTLLHVNVPNLRSMHRLLAVSMNLITDPSHKSETQRLMQQRDKPYDMQSLIAELASSGFDVTEQGSLFVKPFSHKQMQELVDIGFMSLAMLDGLDRLVEWLPDLGSEIWVHARRA